MALKMHWLQRFSGKKIFSTYFFDILKDLSNFERVFDEFFSAYVPLFWWEFLTECFQRSLGYSFVVVFLLDEKRHMTSQI